jgi:hypothetical protein
MPHKDYSHRDVTDKLGLKLGQAVRIVGVRPLRAAPGAQALLASAATKVGRGFVTARTRADVILYWPQTAEEITPTLAKLREQIAPAGGIWVITAKRNCVSASGWGYFNQDAVIPLGKAAGLVDNKICSLSESESAMRFVIRRSERQE